MISLIVSTLGRTDELERFLATLDTQVFRDFEVILVDQNPDDRLKPLLARHCRLPIQHLRSAKGLSRGRNVGLAVARGEIVSIPDDDCWYPPDLLAEVHSWFQQHTDFAILFTAVRDETGELQGPRRRSVEACECDRNAVWHCGISFNAFLRRSVTQSVGQFDERLGVGCPTVFKSGEETDYFLRALDLGYRVWYQPELSICHPFLRNVKRIRRDIYPRAMGVGFVLRRHGYSLVRLCTNFVARSFGGSLISLCTMDFGMAQVRLLQGCGQLAGYIHAGKLLRCEICVQGECS